MTAVTTSLLAASLGFLVAVLVSGTAAPAAVVVAEDGTVRDAPSVPAPRDTAESNVTRTQKADR